MGSILDEQDEINIKAEISDPTDTSGETKVEVIVNGGQTLAEKTFTGGSAVVEFDNLSTGYGYYYLRVTQADKNIAVTAPVWTGESVNAGISNTSSDVAMPIKGTISASPAKIFNNLSDDMTVESLTYTMEGQTEPFHTADVSQICRFCEDVCEPAQESDPVSGLLVNLNYMVLFPQKKYEAFLPGYTAQ